MSPQTGSPSPGHHLPDGERAPGACASPHQEPASPRKESISRFAGSISLATLVSRLAGFVRDILIARAFGASMVADAFFVAFIIPNLLRRMFTEGALSASFIPVFTEVRSRQGVEAARRFSGAMTLLMGGVLAAICVLGAVFAEPFVRAIAPGFVREPEKLALTAGLTRVMFPFLFFIGMWGLAAGTLNASRRFFVPALAPALQNFVMIGALAAAAWLAVGERAVYWLAWAVVIGGLCQWASQLPLLAGLGLLPRPAPPWRTPGMGRCLSLMGPAAFSAGIFQINVLVDKWLASFLPEGSISYLYYGNRLVQFPHGLLSLAVAAAAFPILSERAAEGRRGLGPEAARETLLEAGKLTLFITLPSTFGLMALARPIMEVLFQRGAFGPAASAASAAALQAYAVGLVFFGLVRLLAGVYHANLDTRYPMRCANAGLVTNVVLSVALMFPLGFVGLALATSIASGVNALMLFSGLKRMDADWPRREFLAALRSLGPLSAALGAAVFLANMFLWPAGSGRWAKLLFLLAEIFAAAGVYAWLCARLAPECTPSWRDFLRLGKRGA